MIDVLDDYESQSNRKPQIFWVVFILYLVILIAAIATDIILISQSGFEYAFSQSEISSLLYAIDLFQPIILFVFFGKSRIGWSLIAIIQGFHSARYLKYYYDVISTSQYPLDIIFGSPIFVFFCMACTLITILCFHSRLITFLGISKKIRLFIIAMTVVAMLLGFGLR